MDTPSTTAGQLGPVDSAVKEIDVFNLIFAAKQDDYSHAEVETIKKLASQLLQAMKLTTINPDPVLEGEQRRRVAVAKTHLETAVMFAVKARFVGYLGEPHRTGI